MRVYPDFARLLNRYLVEQERSLSWLSRQLKCNPSTVHRWASGVTRPRDLAMIKGILDLFDIKDPQERYTLFAAAGYLDPEPTTTSYLNHVSSQVSAPTSLTYDFIAYDEYWVGRDTFVQKLSDRIQTNCRLTLLTGMAGIGKTALAERLTLALTPWLSINNSVTRLNFDYQDRDLDFVNVALKWLTDWGEQASFEDQPSPDKILQQLIQILSRQRRLIIIDSLEKAITSTESNGRIRLIDAWWERFFHALLATETLSSRVIVTTQELPEQVVRYGAQYRNRFWSEMLTGLSKTEQDALFQKAGLWMNASEQERRYLTRISQAYAGHPLALRAILGEIKSEFGDNVLAYWQKYRHEFEVVEQDMATVLQGKRTQAVDNWRLDRFSVELQRQVRHRLGHTIDRLHQHAPDAYLLLCTSAEYRRPVKVRFWLGQLAGRGRNEQQQQAALNTLVERSLVEQSRDSQHNQLFGQHNLVRSVALDHHGRLSPKQLDGSDMAIRLRLTSWKLLTKLEIDPEMMVSTVSSDKLSAYLAAICWLTDCTEEGDSSPQAQIDCFLQASHHFCGVEAWTEAWKILSTPLFASTNRTLANQIDAQGLGSEQVAIYSKLVGNLDRLANAHCLRGLGQGYYNRGDEFQVDQAQGHLQEALKEFVELGAVDQIGCTLQTLGIIALYYFGNQQEAQFYFAEAVTVFRQIGDDKGLAHTLHNLASIYNTQGQYEEAHTLYKENLDILYNRLPDTDVVQNAWAHLTYAQFLLGQGQFSDAQKHIQRSIKFFKGLQHRSGLQWAYIHLAGLLVRRQRSWPASVVLHKLVTGFCNVADITHASAIVHHITGMYGLMIQDYDQARQSFQTMLTIFKKLGYLPGYVDAVEGAALVASQCNQVEAAVRLFGAAEAICQKMNIITTPVNRKRNENVLTALQARLGLASFKDAWRTGLSMEIEDAVTMVMNVTSLANYKLLPNC